VIDGFRPAQLRVYNIKTIHVGYRITRVRLEGPCAVDYQVFASGWLQQDRALGRPEDILAMPDVVFLASDDRSGAIYRIRYAPQRRPPDLFRQTFSGE
jgi:glucose/arabinose dehydrogenase